MAFQQVLAEKGYDEGPIIEADFSVESGYQAVKQYLKRIRMFLMRFCS